MSDVVSDLSGCQVNIPNRFTDDILNLCIKDSSRGTKIFLDVSTELRNTVVESLPNMQVKKENLIKELKKIERMVSGNNYKINASPDEQASHSRKVISKFTCNLAEKIISFFTDDKS